MIFQTLRKIPTAAGPRIIIDVSFSSRYNMMTISIAKFIYKVLTEIPSTESFCRQKAISFLNARNSKSVCKTLTIAVRLSSQKSVSR